MDEETCRRISAIVWSSMLMFQGQYEQLQTGGIFSMKCKNWKKKRRGRTISSVVDRRLGHHWCWWWWWWWWITGFLPLHPNFFMCSSLFCTRGPARARWGAHTRYVTVSPYSSGAVISGVFFLCSLSLSAWAQHQTKTQKNGRTNGKKWTINLVPFSLLPVYRSQLVLHRSSEERERAQNLKTWSPLPISRFEAQQQQHNLIRDENAVTRLTHTHILFMAWLKSEQYTRSHR